MRNSIMRLVTVLSVFAIMTACSGGSGGGGGGGTPTPEPVPSGSVTEGGACTADADCVSGLFCLNAICDKAPADDAGGGAVAEGGACTADADCVSGLVCSSNICGQAPAGGGAGGGTEAKDTDGDSVADATDNCVDTANEDQADQDADAKGDACDDSDGDVLVDATDNCVSVSNADQANLDGDEKGDDCDDDKDGDGFANEIDNCQSVSNPAQDDMDKDGIGTMCETSDSKAPAITITSCPTYENKFLGTISTYIPANSVSLTFAIDPSDGIEFTCKLDDKETDCQDKTFSTLDLIEGAHKFYITAVDDEGDVGTEGCEWTVDTTAPTDAFAVSLTPKWRGATVSVIPTVSEADIDTNFATYAVDYGYAGEHGLSDPMKKEDFEALTLYNGVMYDVYVVAYDYAGNYTTIEAKNKKTVTPTASWKTSVVDESDKPKMANIGGVLIDNNIALLYGYGDDIENQYPYRALFNYAPKEQIQVAEIPVYDPIATSSSRLAMAKADDGRSYIAYIAKVGDKYVVEHVYINEQFKWVYEKAYESISVLSNPSIALHGSDVWIAFDNQASGRLGVSQKTAGTWANPINLDKSVLPTQPSIAVKGDNIYVTYRKKKGVNDYSALTMAYCTHYANCSNQLQVSEFWTKITIDDGDASADNGGSPYANDGSFSKLVFDSNDYPNIAYFGTDQNKVFYAWNPSADYSQWSSGWQFVSVNSDAYPANGGFFTMAMDASDNKHFVWSCANDGDCQTGKLYYAFVTPTGTSYVSLVDTLENKNTIGGDMVMFAPDNSSMWICYSDMTASKIKCAMDWNWVQ